MKLNFNVPILDLDDHNLTEDGRIDGKPLMLGKVLAKQMITFTDFGDALKLMETWARPMYRGEDIEFDSSDLLLFKGILENPKLGLFPITKVAALNLINRTNGTNGTPKA